MAQAKLTIDLSAVVENWRALDGLSSPQVETAAVVKADAYGLGAASVGKALVRAGAQSFFVAVAEEGVQLRKSVGNGAKIYVFSGLMAGDEALVADYDLIPLINDPAQWQALQAFSDQRFGIQIDTGMNRLGMEAEDFAKIAGAHDKADLIISHLACADEPDHAHNALQLAAFHAMTDGIKARKSLAATGGTLLGPDFHFDLCRPGIGLYGGMPFADATPVVRLSLPIIQTRLVQTGEAVGYGASWQATRDSRIATLASGYADGLIRAMGFGSISLFDQNRPCPLVGRVSMDLLTVDVTDLDQIPSHLDLICPHQPIDVIAEQAGTIGYEILTAISQRYDRALTER